MIAPTVGRFLPGYTGCNWTVDQAGKVLCATRRDLHRAVVEITKMPAKTKQQADVRDYAFKAANEALEAHHCTPAPEMQARPVGGGSVHAVAESAPAGPVSLLDITEAHHKAVRAAQRMVELRGGPPSEHEAALDAFVAADRVFHETLYAYRTPLRRMPISAFLPEGEWPQG